MHLQRTFFFSFFCHCCCNLKLNSYTFYGKMSLCSQKVLLFVFFLSLYIPNLICEHDNFQTTRIKKQFPLFILSLSLLHKTQTAKQSVFLRIQVRASSKTLTPRFTDSLLILRKKPDCFAVYTRRGWPCNFPPKKSRVTFGLPNLLIELFYIGMPVVLTDGRAVGGRLAGGLTQGG